MSDYHRVCLHFDLRADTPDPLVRAFTAAAAGKPPDPADLEHLPEVFRDHIRPAEPVEDAFHSAMLFALRFSKDLQPLPNAGPDAPLYRLYYEEIFHDDAWANWSIFFMLGLFRYAASDGYLASFEALPGYLPDLYLKTGDEIVTVRLEATEDTLWPFGYPKPKPLVGEQPIGIKSDGRFSITEAADQADSVTIGDMY